MARTKAQAWDGANHEALLARLLQLFQQLGTTRPDGISTYQATQSLNCSFPALKNAVRSRPTEFALYNRRGKQVVMCFAYCTVRACGSCQVLGTACRCMQVEPCNDKHSISFNMHSLRLTSGLRPIMLPCQQCNKS
jgi:hypothetical protein